MQVANMGTLSRIDKESLRKLVSSGREDSNGPWIRENRYTGEEKKIKYACECTLTHAQHF